MQGRQILKLHHCVWQVSWKNHWRETNNLGSYSLRHQCVQGTRDQNPGGRKGWYCESPLLLMSSGWTRKVTPSVEGCLPFLTRNSSFFILNRKDLSNEFWNSGLEVHYLIFTYLSRMLTLLCCMSTLKFIILRVTITMFHINIIYMLYVDIIFLACRKQK